MSGKIMGQVYDRELPARQQAVLLALADHADHDGANAWCSVGKMAHKLGCSARTIHYRLRELEASGVLVRTGTRRDTEGHGGAIVYRIHLEALPRKAEYTPVCKSCTPGSDQPGVQKTPSRSAKKAKPVCNPVADKPSLKPSIKPASDRLAAIEAAGGYVSFHGRDLRQEWVDAIGEDTAGTITVVLHRGRLPNGKRIRMPSGYLGARTAILDAIQAEAQREAAQREAAAREQAEREQAERVVIEAARTIRRIRAAIKAQDLPAGEPPAACATVWDSLLQSVRDGKAPPFLASARLRVEWPAFATWYDRVLGAT
jgi:DNA-binding Lrp family transcriptional regulator